MPQDQLRNTIDALRAKLQQELESQLSALAEQQDQAVEAARRAAEAEAEARWTARAEEVRSEWIARLQSEVSAARAEAERRFLADVARLKSESEQAAAALTAKLRAEADAASAQFAGRLRAEVEQAVAATASRVREEADAEIEAERQRTNALLDAERARSQSDLDAERKRAAGLLDAERQRFDAERLQFRAERQRFEAERQQFAIERQRFESTATEYAATAQGPAASDESIRRLEAELAAERDRLAEVNEALSRATESLRRVESALEHEQQARAHEQAVHAEAMTAADEERAQLTAASVAAQPVPATPVVDSARLERVLAAMTAMDRSRSLTEILEALVQAAGAEAPRAALFIVSAASAAGGSHLQGLKARGFDGVDIGTISMAAADDALLGAAVKRREPVTASAAEGVRPPGFAQTAGAALAVPLAIGGEPVAVLYADGGPGDAEAGAAWPETVQIHDRPASSCLAHVTAARTAQAMRLAAGAPRGDDESSARRYARLLVSEIKLYHEAAVRAGREHRDLLGRLQPEISRARKLYEERVAGGGSRHFEQELVHTLADGNPALLGEPA